jgi:hypothetical protein
MFDRIEDWVNVQPVVVFLMAIAAILIFSTPFIRSQDRTGTFWSWVRRIMQGVLGTLVFLGMLWGFRTLLNNNMATFYATHGSVNDLSLQSAESIWGRSYQQEELSVGHFIWRDEQQEIPSQNPNDAPKYKTVAVRHPVPQNSIVGFTGKMDMQLSEREKGYALYSGFTVSADFAYDILNDSTETTDVDWTFPLAPGQALFEDFKITLDEKDISSLLRFGNDQVTWQTRMTPQQRHKLHVSHKSRGMNYLYYRVPFQRQIKDFTFTLTVDRLPTTLLNYPDGVLTPTKISPTADGQGSVLTWDLDNAITVAGMGVSLLSPIQPGAQVLQVLVNSSYALTLLIAVLSLTLLILGEQVSFVDLALVAGIVTVQYLIMAAVSDLLLGFWGSLIFGAALTNILAYLLFRHHPSRLLRILVMILIGFFTVVYPLAGLYTQVTDRNIFDGLMQIMLIIYLFALTLYTRLKVKPAAPVAPVNVNEAAA